MKQSDVSELHYITAIENVPSILRRGILGNHRAHGVAHVSVADPEVQARRSIKRVPTRTGHPRALYSFVNLYFNARNPMMYRRRDIHRELCVLRVNPDVLDLPEVTIADINAAAALAKFMPVAAGLEAIDHSVVFAEYWSNHLTHAENYYHRQAMCAEVLVPDGIAPEYIVSAYVSCVESQAELGRIASRLGVSVNTYMFFR